MAYRKKYVKKRYVPKKRTYARKKKGITLVSGSHGPFRMKRSTNTATYTTIANTTISSFGAFVFSLNQVPNYSEFTTLFDNYRIEKCVVKFTAVGNQMNTTTTPNQVPRIGTVFDYDDNSSPADWNALEQYSSFKVHAGNKSFSMTVYPKISLACYRSGVTDGYVRPDNMLSKHLMVDSSNSDIPHYGLKWGFESNLTANVFIYEIQVDYYLTFFGLR